MSSVQAAKSLGFNSIMALFWHRKYNNRQRSCLGSKYINLSTSYADAKAFSRYRLFECSGISLAVDGVRSSSADSNDYIHMRAISSRVPGVISQRNVQASWT
ncbi:hypothetical protein N7478_002704 [Penicillium angulare]|uniref:uncharacterized protein n=1 Tax=Penicillium angulare TaxID=116970 RepID=UPI002541A2DC|nr:uncharacterized protein N7478_002704 [Penicillium angulare]KAJ5287018.1 hypothetical protein N7478_002704 [Penicillium angulare]